MHMRLLQPHVHLVVFAPLHAAKLQSRHKTGGRESLYPLRPLLGSLTIRKDIRFSHYL